MPAQVFSRYGLQIVADDPDRELKVEMEAIRRGGVWHNKGKLEGLGLAQHYKNACRLIWPHLDWHRWMELCNNEVRRGGAKCTVLMGCGSSGKTNMASWQYLLEYYCNPHDTLVLISSTDMRGLELRCWGEIKMLHEKATERYPGLPGYLIDSKHCITTDELGEDEVTQRMRTRDLRKGVIGIPTVQGGKNIGLGRWVGIKQKHLRLIADDCTAMAPVFLAAFANLNNNIDFQAIILGNPDDTLDPLGIASEPKEGWSSHLEPEKTSVWDTKFFNGRCINLVGTDSPNFDQPETLYPYLISKKKIDETLSAFAADSFEYFSQCVGVMKISQLSRRVITRDLCTQFNARDNCLFDGDSPLTRICALDAAYGGDRMPIGYIEFGRCLDGKVRVKMYAPTLLSLKARTTEPMDAENQIAVQVKAFCELHSIPPANFFHDSTGRGSLGTALARVWSADCNPVEFGGKPTQRPVSTDHFIYDKKTGQRRLQRCDEFYSKFVTEMWFSIRYTIEADQMRGLTEPVIHELSSRRWTRTKDDLIKVETKVEFKEQFGYSPDLADWLSICIEGARRKGFTISKLSAAQPNKNYDWLSDMRRERQELKKSKQLQEA
jgi:hypothetical protein